MKPQTKYAAKRLAAAIENAIIAFHKECPFNEVQLHPDMHAGQRECRLTVNEDADKSESYNVIILLNNCPPTTPNRL